MICQTTLRALPIKSEMNLSAAQEPLDWRVASFGFAEWDHETHFRAFPLQHECLFRTTDTEAAWSEQVALLYMTLHLTATCNWFDASLEYLMEDSSSHSMGITDDAQ